MSDKKVSLIGVDMGGTKVRTARVVNGKVTHSNKEDIYAFGTENEIIDQLIKAIYDVWDESALGIGLGIPSVMDIDKGIVYDVQNIPSWKEVHLKSILEKEFNVPIYLNNDANCFAAGEKYFGVGKDVKDMVGLIIGTGMAGGLIINNRLFNGPNCGAGEFGMMPYKKFHYEYYCSGQYFIRKYKIKGEDLYDMASMGNKKALRAFEKLGMHIGNAIKAILYSVDPELIVFGGSVSKGYAFFKGGMAESLKDFVYPQSLQKLKIEVSTDPDIPVLGAAALYMENIAK